MVENFIKGGAGDDTWVNTVAYGEREGSDFIGKHQYFGQDGNDYITSSH